MLVNAIYFLADWLNPFAKEGTRELPFTVAVAPGQTRPAMMMVREGTYRTAKTGGVSVLELPYAGGAAAMIIVLPDQVDGLEAVEASLDTARLTRWVQALTSQEVLLWLPRFVLDPPRVKVDEKGTEAAAATAVEELEGSVVRSDPVPELKIDHPFLFFIVDRTSGLVLFMGRVTDPQAPSGSLH